MRNGNALCIGNRGRDGRTGYPIKHAWRRDWELERTARGRACRISFSSGILLAHSFIVDCIPSATYCIHSKVLRFSAHRWAEDFVPVTRPRCSFRSVEHHRVHHDESHCVRAQSRGLLGGVRNASPLSARSVRGTQSAWHVAGAVATLFDRHLYLRSPTRNLLSQRHTGLRSSLRHYACVCVSRERQDVGG